LQRVQVEIRTFDSKGRGVGVLPDGTIVVCEDAEVGETATCEIYNIIETAAGKVLIGKKAA
jgi:uncharacterized protein YacL